MYYFIPQHAWGLVTMQDPETVTGFYSSGGGGCRPVALVCQASQRGAFAHWDTKEVLTSPLLAWITDDQPTRSIDVFTTADNMQDVKDAIEALAFAVNVQPATEPGVWGFTFVGEQIGPVLPPDDQEPTPPSWSTYWPGAPSWQENGETFCSLIISSTNGFFANYNGVYYMEWDLPLDSSVEG